MEIRLSARRHIENYFTFKILCLICLVACLALGLIAIQTCCIYPTAWQRSLRELAQYAPVYWSAHPMTLATGLTLTVLVFILDGLRNVHAFLVRHEALVTSRRTAAQGAIAIALTLAAILLATGLVPLLHVHSSEWTIVAIAMIPIPLAIASYAVAFGSDLPVLKRVAALATNRYPNRTTKVSAMSVQSRQSDRALERYRALTRRYDKQSSEVQEFLQSGERSLGWPGINAFFALLARLLGNTHPQEITLHDRTLEAIGFALREVAESRDVKMVILSDAEYPGVKELVQGVFGSASVVVREIPLRSDLWNGVDPTAVVETYKKECGKAAPESSILIVSHIQYELGLEFDLPQIRDAVGEEVVIVADGAQALGRLLISEEAIKAADYYATCTHKWALGEETLGVLRRNGARLGQKKIEERRGTRGLSRYNSLSSGSVETLGTISLGPYISASISLQEIEEIGVADIHDHGCRLARMFQRGLERRGIGRYIRAGASNATVVAVCDGEQAEIWSEHGTELVGSGSATDREAFRFCFHFIHSDQDVIRLLDELDRPV